MVPSIPTTRGGIFRVQRCRVERGMTKPRHPGQRHPEQRHPGPDPGSPRLRGKPAMTKVGARNDVFTMTIEENYTLYGIILKIIPIFAPERI